MPTTIDFADLMETIANAGFTPRRYSGRGMYGKDCLGITCRNPINTVCLIIAEYAQSLAKDQAAVADLAEALKDAHTDSMGRDAIVYWEHIAWDPEVAKDYEGDEDEDDDVAEEERF